MNRVVSFILACTLTGGAFAQQYTTGYEPHFRPEEPGTLLFRSPVPEWGGRLTNIIYHQGWLMTGYENPGSNSQTNDLRFRVMDVSNLENDPEPVPFWPSDFGLDYGTNNRGREHWYTGNWGYNTHGHGRTATHVHWPVLNVQTFGGAVFKGIDADEVRFNYGWNGPANSGRLRRQLPWNADQDWAYGSNNESIIYVTKAWRDNPTGSYNAGNYTAKGIAKINGGNLGVRGFPEMLGDKFFINSDQRMSGIAVYQIPDDRLANYSSGAPVPDMQLLGASTEEFGGYWPELWASRDGGLYSVGAVSGKIVVMDLTDFSDPKIIREFTDRGDGRGIRVRNAQYPKFQDDYLLIEKYVIDMQAMIDGVTDPVVLELDEPPPVQGRWRGGFDPSQFSFPLGNLIVTGGYGDVSGGLFIHVRQQEPDTTPPTVRYHIPEADRTNYSRYMPINVIIHEELDSRTLNNGVNFMIREVVDSEPVGDPIDVIFNLGSNNVMTLTPVDPLDANTTYQVDFPSENGIMDISGNRIVDYSWRFSTGSEVEPIQPVPEISSFAVDQFRAAPSEAVTISATVEDTGLFQYRIDYGDGSGFGAWQDLAAGEHDLALTRTFAEIGRYNVRLQVRDNHDIPENASLSVLVYEAATGIAPTRSSPIIVASDGHIWVVNPDADTVTVMETSGAKLGEYAVGKDPRAIAEDANGTLWVTCFDSDEIYLLDASGGIVDVIALDYGTSPFAAVASPDGQTMYVSAYGSGGLFQFDVSATDRPVFVPLGPTARAIAVNGDHSRVYVTRFISPRFHGEVWSIDPQTYEVSTLRVEFDETPDGNNSGSGVTNYISGIAISPDNGLAVVVGKKDNTFRGLLFENGAPNHENTVRTTLAVLDLETETEVVPARRDFDNADSPTAVTFSPDGTMIFVTIQGNNHVQTIDALKLTDPVNATAVLIFKNTGNASETDPTGLAPQGLVIDPVTQRMFTQNFMSRSMTAFDVSPALDENQFNFEQIGEYSTVANELLTDEVLLGKQIFYNAADARMGAESYLSCATCHVDGGHDGRVWDFTNRGEGLRNTTDLRGRSGMGHGNVHWSANFDEIQDFELDMVNHFNGDGFIGGGPNASLGAPNAGLSAELDAMAAYVASLDESTLRRSPHREPDGSHSDAALAGALVFRSLDCASCHRPDRGFTDSTVGAAILHNVGTLRNSSGMRLGGSLPGIDTPTLLGAWDAAPYLHDGSADTLMDVFRAAGGTDYMAADTILSSAIVATYSEGANYGKAAFGDFVIMDGAGQAIQFAGVDGGAGGIGQLELRAYAASEASLTLSINGNAAFPVTVPASAGPHAWSSVRVSAGSLGAGETNSIVVTNVSSEPVAIDKLTVATAGDLDAAYSHRKVLGISQTDRDNLIAFLLELDQGWSGPELFPSAPTDLAALAVSDDQINLMFVDGSILETGYVIQYRAEGGSWQTIEEGPVTGSGSALFYAFPDLAQGTVYAFRVAALTGETQTAWSETVSATPLTAPGSDPIELLPVDDAYIEGGNAINDAFVKVENNSRTGYMKFDIPVFDQPLLSASFRFAVRNDGNNRGGTFRITEGSHNDWTEENLSASNAPGLTGKQLADVDGNRAANQTYTIPLNGLQTGFRTLVLQKIAGGDFWMSSKEGAAPPALILEYADGEVTPPDAPTIIAQPADTSVGYGETLQLAVAVDARSEAGFRWYRDGVPLSNGGPFSGVYSDTLTVYPTGPGAAGTYSVVVTDLAGSAASADAVVTLTGENPFDSWRANHFPDAPSDPAVIGNHADPDADGIANVFEYLFASSPHLREPSKMPKIRRMEDRFAFEFRMRETPGVAYSVKYSSDLSTWHTVDPDDLEEVSNEDGVRVIHVGRDVAAGSHVFFRIETD